MDKNFEEGKRLFGLRRWDLALAELLQADPLEFTAEQNIDFAYYLGLCYTKLEQYDDALIYLEQVITAAADPLRVSQCRMTMAYIYCVNRRYKMAEFELGQLEKNGFASTQIYATLAYAAWAQKHFEKAVDLYEKALELDAANPTALNGLGYILSDTGLDTGRGLRFCRRAVDLNPTNAAYLDSLGWAYYKAGDLQEARAYLKRAQSLAPHQKEIASHYRKALGKSR
jgi:tetratricopeptide (TPR) repeat protein